MKMVQGLDIRPSPIVGTWYEGNPEKLTRNIDAFLAVPGPYTDRGQVNGVIVPHAGHVYSGGVAGYAFAALKDARPEKVVVLSPMHQGYPFPIITTSHNYYQTPLGNIKVDHKSLDLISDSLVAVGGARIKPIPHDQEHSLEIELPFLQRCLTGPFELIPIMVREYDIIRLRLLGEIISSTIKNVSNVVVASTDLSHFYSDSVARKLDKNILTAISSFSPEKVLQVVMDGNGEACGLAAVITAMFITKALGADAIDIVNYQNSGAVTGDRSSVVGYGSAVIFTRNKI